MNFIDKILKEAISTNHVLDRLHDRFTSSSSTLKVGFESSPMQYTVVGTYEIPQNIQASITDTILLIKSYNFPKGKDLGIKIAEINIDKNKVNYTSDNTMELTKKNNQPLVFVDVEGSNGNTVYGIVRKNEFTTVYFGKSYTPQTTQKLQVDFLVSNLKKAIEQQKIR